MTLETVAAAQLLRAARARASRVRVVNVVDLMTLHRRRRTTRTACAETDVRRAVHRRDVDVVFAFHGYAARIHQLVHGRPNASRFHVRGFSEQGTTTTPFDMVVLNRMSRYHLAMDALQRARRIPETRAG